MLPESWVSVDQVAAHLGVAKDRDQELTRSPGWQALEVKLSEIDEWMHADGTGRMMEVRKSRE
jgi:hypothetical protein